MKNNNYIKAFLFATVFAFIGCEDTDYSFGEIIAPTNLVITAEKVGADATNPNGDGSGVVNFSTSADNAVSYKYVLNGVESLSLSGKETLNFTTLGTNTYTVTVVASGMAGVSSSKSIEVEVLSTYAPPAALIEKLYGYDAANPSAVTSKTWRILSSAVGHFGLGPAGGTYPEYYQAGIDEKADVGMYDDRITFSSDGSFTYVTNGTILGRNPFVVDDLGPNTSGVIDGDDITNYVYGDHEATFALTAPVGVETINLSGLGFIAYYTGGNHEYQILEELWDRKNEDELYLKTTDASGELDWYFMLTSE